MKIAVTCEKGEVFQHFGHTPEFAVFETNADGKTVVGESLIECGDTGHGALAGLLTENGIDILICGGIGGGAVNALAQAGIQVVGGAEGAVRAAAEAFLTGALKGRSDFLCAHHQHGEGHTCSEHGCGK